MRALRTVQDNATLEASAPWLNAEEAISTDVASPLHLWIARELHDLVVQPVTAALVGLDVVRRDAGSLGPEGADVLQRDLRAALHGLRRLMGELRGLPATCGDLVASLTDAVAEVRERTGLDAHLEVSPGWPDRLPAQTSRNLQRIVEEALRNVIRHSGASRVEVRLDELQGALRVSVTDNGILAPSADGGMDITGMGITGMHERAVIIGGVLTVDHEPHRSTVAVCVDELCAGSVTR